MPVTKVCQRCSVVFTPKWPRNPNTYCSRQCHLDGLHDGNRGDGNANWKPTIAKVCEWCGAAYEVKPWGAERRRWCSRTCTDAAHRHIRGKDHPLYKPKVAMRCEVCGTVRMVKPSLVSRFRSCSNRCNAALARESAARTSTLEDRVAAVLDALGEPYEAQRRFRWYAVDFYLPARGAVLECDGAYWHGLAKQQRLDRAKDTYFANRGVPVVRLTEAEIKRDAVDAVRRALHRLTPRQARLTRLE